MTYFKSLCNVHLFLILRYNLLYYYNTIPAIIYSALTSGQERYTQFHSNNKLIMQILFVFYKKREIRLKEFKQSTQSSIANVIFKLRPLLP